jgi:ribosome-associated protein
VGPLAEPEPVWAVEAARAAAEKTSEEIVVLEVGDLLAITDYFVITGGRNPRQVRTIAEEVERRITADGGPKPIRIEGLDDLRWVLMDYGDFVVHVFLNETRDYYQLEKLWRDVPRVRWEAPAAASAERGSATRD